MDSMLVTRIKTSIVIIIPLALVLWAGGVVLGITTLLLFLAVNYEFYSLHKTLPRPRQVQFIVANCLPLLGYYVAGWSGFAGGVVLGSVLSLILNVIIIETETHEIDYVRTTPATMLGFVYLSLVASIMVIIGFSNGANILICWLLAVVIFSDSLAYFCGSFFGGEKLSPRISPNKTISGSVGGLCGAILASFLADYCLELGLGIAQCVAFGLLGGLLSQVGDLVESLIKRVYQVKDMGDILPGHGGILDRVDAFIFASPILFFLNV